MENSNQRMRILEMIDEGRITAEEGLSLLQILTDQDADVQTNTNMQSRSEDPADFAVSFQQSESDTAYPSIETDVGIHTTIDPETAAPNADLAADISKWKRWWMIPLWIGVAITTFGGLFMFQTQQSNGFGFWFICAALPFTIGLVMIVLAWQSRTAPWLHLRVQQRPGERPERIAFSLPLPLRQAAWFMRVFGNRFSGMQIQDLEQVLQAVGKTATPENPIYIQVDEAENGEKVEIYVG